MIEIVRDADSASPDLNIMATGRMTLPEAEIVLADGSFEIHLENALVTAIGIDGTQEGLPLERLVLDFGSITLISTETNTEIAYCRSGCGGATRDSVGDSFVFFGPGVPSNAFPDAIPFTTLRTGIANLYEYGALDGRISAEPVTLVTAANVATIRHVLDILGNATVDSVDARFTALGDGGAIIDRYAINLEHAAVESVLLETDPSGTLNETIGFVYGLIRWSAQPGNVVGEWTLGFP